MDAKIVGKTKDAGFQIGVRKTFDIAPRTAWEIMFSGKGIEAWLGAIGESFELGKSYKTDEGIEGKVTVFKEYSHIRATWQKPSWNKSSILQVRVMDAKGKSTISFHQDHLQNAAQRVEMKAHWDQVIKKLENILIKH